MTKSARDIIYRAAQSLKNVTSSPQREACLLLAHVLNTPYEDIYFAKDYLVSDTQEAAFSALLERRLKHEPLSKIRECREFWSLPFRVTANTLDPRPDSETLIETVLRLYPGRNQQLRILDLGTGTGCLLLSLLHEFPNATGIGIDFSESAILVAQENAQNLNLINRAAFSVGNWGQAIKGSFDIIVSNPPYIARTEILPSEVRGYDPELALYGGEDGLECYRALATQIPSLTTQETKLILELGAGQLDAVTSIFSCFSLLQTTSDLSGQKRCAVFCKKSMLVVSA